MQSRAPLSAGQRFGRLTLVEKAQERRYNETWWVCRCDCGQAITARQLFLKRGNTRSCGCIRKEQCRERTQTHGMTNTPEYHVWCGMKKRCNDPKDSHYHRYGGRGIRVCERWARSFEHFIADMGRRPTWRHSLDRIDGDGDYAPENCRWATPKQQGSRTSRVQHLTVDGVTRNLSEWAEQVGGTRTIIRKRLARGWSLKRAVSEPVHRTNRKKM